VTDDALRFAHRATEVELPDAVRLRLLKAFHELEPWPDVAPTFAALAELGIGRAVLSNFTTAMLKDLRARASLEELDILSVDAARAYKPDPRAYGLATQHYGCRARNIAFVAFAGWDAAGARHFGFRTYWANRLHASTELLGATADRTASGLDELVSFVAQTPRGPRHT
jgi:2-haloacid dehalogenase